MQRLKDVILRETINKIKVVIMLSIETKLRKVKGKKVSSLRRSDLLPAVVYGDSIKSLAIQVDAKKFRDIFRQAGENVLISLAMEKSDGSPQKLSVLIHDIQKDPVSGEFIHVDFYHPSMKKKIEATVPLKFQGESIATKNNLGTLVKEVQEIIVKGLATNLPKEIIVDISKLENTHDKLLLRDLTIEEDVEILGNPDSVIVAVVPIRKIEEELEEPVGEVQEAEVEEKGKGLEEGEQEEKGQKEGTKK